jgi:hypothetical protein
VKLNKKLMKIYIDGQNAPKTPGWCHVSTHQELVDLLKIVDLDQIELIYFGKNLDDNEGFPSFTMYDCAVTLIEAFGNKNKKLPECTVVRKKYFHMGGPAIDDIPQLLKHYSKVGGFKSKCVEIN